MYSFQKDIILIPCQLSPARVVQMVRVHTVLQTRPEFVSHQCMSTVCTSMSIRKAAMLATRRPAGVTPVVNLRESGVETLGRCHQRLKEVTWRCLTKYHFCISITFSTLRQRVRFVVVIYCIAEGLPTKSV